MTMMVTMMIINDGDDDADDDDDDVDDGVDDDASEDDVSFYRNCSQEFQLFQNLNNNVKLTLLEFNEG